MRSLLVKPASFLKGEITLLGDKSIAHRSIITASLTKGKTIIENFPANEDCLYTIDAFKKLGIKIRPQHLKASDASVTITIFGNGLYGLRKPKGPIFVGNSGTTLRLVLGVLAGCDFRTKLVAGKSLSRRPMLRVTEPLRLMGAEISAKRKGRQSAKREEYPPITISGGKLKAITYKLPVTSAQVKSAILLAGLFAEGNTCVIEPVKTRDHTELILKLFKAEIKLTQNSIVIIGRNELTTPGKIYIPGDISSASFFVVLSSILPGSEILIKGVSLNPSRAGMIRVLKRMGANIKINPSTSVRIDGKQSRTIKNFEPMGDIIVKSSNLRGIRIRKDQVPSLIDELPILMVAACLAKGKTVFEGVQELRVKETDRIRSMSENLKKMGALIRVTKIGRSENIIIEGVKDLAGCQVKSFGDHRTAMSMVIAGLKAKGKTHIDDISCIKKSFPRFIGLLKSILNKPN